APRCWCSRSSRPATRWCSNPRTGRAAATRASRSARDAAAATFVWGRRDSSWALSRLQRRARHVLLMCLIDRSKLLRDSELAGNRHHQLLGRGDGDARLVLVVLGRLTGVGGDPVLDQGSQVLREVWSELEARAETLEAVEQLLQGVERDSFARRERAQHAGSPVRIPARMALASPLRIDQSARCLQCRHRGAIDGVVAARWVERQERL